MSFKIKMTGRLVAAGRALAGVSREAFAESAGIPIETMALIEANGSAWLHSDNDVEALSRAFNNFGIIVVEEGDGMGAGVRLKFNRQDVKQISLLEGEGGIVRSDDAP